MGGSGQNVWQRLGRDCQRRIGRSLPLVWAVGVLVAAGCEEFDLRFDPDAGLIISPARPDGGTTGPSGGNDAGITIPLPPPVPPPPPGATACQRALQERGVGYTVAAQPMASAPGRPDIVCMVDDPVSIRPVVRGVTYRPGRVNANPTAMFMSCSLALSVDEMSQQLAARGVTDVVYLGIYGCRVVAGTSTLSEHGRGRAIDLATFKLASGATYTVLSDWEKNQPAPVTMAGSFLRQTVTALHQARIFSIILTPDYNADHANHFHLDITPDASLFK
ncbi:MAG TPA: extensin family protein [Polyangia bacterium]